MKTDKTKNERENVHNVQVINEAAATKADASNEANEQQPTKQQPTSVPLLLTRRK